MTVDLGATFCGLTLKNPIIAASGTFGYGEDMTDFFDPSLLGGIATKGISLLPKEGNRTPRIWETASGMLNAIGLNNVGLDAFIEKKMPFLRSLKGTICIVNFYGHSIPEYALLAERLSAVDGVHAVEMNISCPNVKEGGIVFGADPVLMAEVISEARKRCRLPLIVKLSPNVTSIARMAETAVAAGADALSLVNTFTGMAVDVRTRRPILANVFGGLSGPAIKPLALRMTYEVCQATKVPVIGMGGILNAMDALEFLMVGAKAVQVGTASFVNPTAMPEIIEGIERYLTKEGMRAVADWIGCLELPGKPSEPGCEKTQTDILPPPAKSDKPA
ncbi:MAG: dihydroorotate dehydrogenase [Myxococcales bacterium]|nr:MAG: dihydroorotate dehydrogenase [Myxococcales bacterium]